MLTIKLSPQRRNPEQLIIEWYDPILKVNDENYDLSLIGDGDTAEHDILKIVERTLDDYEVTMILPHGAKAPESTRFPEDIILIGNGSITLPPYEEGE